MKRTRLAPLLALMIAALMAPMAAQASPGLEQTFNDDFPWTSRNQHNWGWEGGSVAISGGIANLTGGELRSTSWLCYGNLTFRARLQGTGNDNSQVILRGPGYHPGDNFVKLIFTNQLVKISCKVNAAYTDSPTVAYNNNTYEVYTLLWEEDRVRLYINHTYKTQVTANVFSDITRLTIITSAGTEALFDWVEYHEDREANFETPDLVNTWGYPTLSNRTWFSGNGTWLLRTAGLDTNMTVFIPSEWRSYFCEVKVDGAGHTNLGFTRSTRTLEVKGLSSSNVSISMVDPPEWVVNFAYWFGSATGISLLPLLKIWDRLAKKHKALPYVAILLGLVFMVFAVWFTWQWIRFHAIHVSL